MVNSLRARTITHGEEEASDNDRAEQILSRGGQYTASALTEMFYLYWRIQILDPRHVEGLVFKGGRHNDKEQEEVTL